MPIVYSSLNHPQRVQLAAEVHSRPPMRLKAPETLTHLAVFAQDGDVRHENNLTMQHELLRQLCAHFGVTPPAPHANYFFHDFGRFRLKWECHTEFATFTFAEHVEAGLPTDEAFQRAPLFHLPEEWLMKLQGRLIVAAHVVVEKSGPTPQPLSAEMRRLFEGTLIVGGNVMRGAEIWTDFQIQSDGFSRFLIRDVNLFEQQTGRLAQRVLEIETYRVMATFGLPQAHHAMPVLNEIENDLARLTAMMVNGERSEPGSDAENRLRKADKEQALLHELTGLAARIERLSLDNSYRFSASQAYFRLVRARIEELREMRIEGVVTLEEFMDRRLAPAMNTCVSTERRLAALADRIAHTNDLLRTRVNLVQEQQNRKILQSMNVRSAQQLRLQQAVEGLSVVAISYYLIGLTLYAAKAAKAAGLPVNPDLAAGLVVPVIAVGVWAALRKLRKHLHAGEKGEGKGA
jgi:uncharacterized membrane-anchored protein